MTVDLAIVGAPFLDLVFAGLERLPAPGEETLADELRWVPGGTAMQAIGAARLGLATTLVAPRADDPQGAALARALREEGVTWTGPPARSTPTTAVLPGEGGAAMVTVLAPGEPSARDVASVGARAVALSLGRLGLRPARGKIFAVTGALELASDPSRRLVELPHAHVVICNAAEARALTQTSAPDEAAHHLARRGPVAVVTDGPAGAWVGDGGAVEHVPAPRVDSVDATGAGDLFVAAYAWADLRGAPAVEAARWATLAASLSVRTTTALEGAARLVELLEAGGRAGLSPP
jgi:sugar/nucleoside kinase (ribokinase family)